MRAMRVLKPIPSLVLLACILAPGAAVSQAAPAAPHRVALMGPEGQPFGYTVEIPAGWVVRPASDKKGQWLAPAGADPEKDPRAVFVRPSPADLRDPAATVRSIEASDQQDDTWAAPLVAVREVGGAKGVVVQMDSGQGVTARSLLVLKLPVGATSVDLIGTAPRALFAALRPGYETILFSALAEKK